MTTADLASHFAKLFDHSLVRPDAARDELLRAAHAAAEISAATLTVQPHYIGLAAEALRDSGVLVGTVVGFPHGNETPAMSSMNRPCSPFLRAGMFITMSISCAPRSIAVCAWKRFMAGARRFGSTRSDQFVRAFLDLPAKQAAAFEPYLASLPLVAGSDPQHA